MSVANLTTLLGAVSLSCDADHERIRRNPNILSDLLKEMRLELQTLNWQTTSTNVADTICRRVLLQVDDPKYTTVKNYFNKTMRRGFTVDKIERVENPYLFVQYNLKKLKKAGCSIMCLFHGTTEEKVQSICEENFNWRLTGTSVGHRFGKGISFSPSSTYASHYPHNNHGRRQRVMILAEVLAKSACRGNPSMNIPSGSFDTSAKPDGSVIVKYEDNDFYPKYVIYYSL